ncbi:MAG: GatB/YqeY domain-containing protein [Candidatus Sulfobium sp.]
MEEQGGNDMDFMEKITRDLAEAMKSHGEERDLVISVIRMIKSAVKNVEISLRGSGRNLGEEDIIGVLSTMVKQRRESVEQYLSANRKDLADKESREVEIIQRYLPRQLTPEELDTVIRAAIEETGVTSVKETGRLMKVLMPRVKGKADGRLVSQRVREMLESL